MCVHGALTQVASAELCHVRALWRLVRPSVARLHRSYAAPAPPALRDQVKAVVAKWRAQRLLHGQAGGVLDLLEVWGSTSPKARYGPSWRRHCPILESHEHDLDGLQRMT